MKARTRDLAIPTMMTVLGVGVAARSLGAAFTAPEAGIGTWPLLIVMPPIAPTALAGVWAGATSGLLGQVDGGCAACDSCLAPVRAGQQGEADV